MYDIKSSYRGIPITFKVRRGPAYAYEVWLVFSTKDHLTNLEEITRILLGKIVEECIRGRNNKSTEAFLHHNFGKRLDKILGSNNITSSTLNINHCRAENNSYPKPTPKDNPVNYLRDKLGDWLKLPQK